MSPLVRALALTCESKARPDLNELAKKLTPADGAYQKTLQNVATRDVIPWLGTIDTLPFIRLSTKLRLDLRTQTFTFPHSTRVLPIPIPLSKWPDILWLISSIAAR